MRDIKKDNFFQATWFGNSLNKSSGIKLWVESDMVAILNQPAYTLKTPINWLDNPYKHRSWCWILNAFQWMDQLLARYKLTDDIEAIQKCALFFLDWIDFYIVKKQTGEFLWKDDAVSFRAFRIAIVSGYILSSDDYSLDQKKLVKEVLDRHFLELSDRKKFKSNNHGIFQMRALMSLLTMHPSIGDIDESGKYVVERLNWLWKKQYGSQNIHLENSTGYHQYIIKEFNDILHSPEMKRLKFIFNQADVDEVIENSKYFFHPNGIGTLFGDSNLTTQKHDLFFGDHIFNEAGYVFLAGNDASIDNSYMAIRTGFPNNAHRHSDDFSFEWSEKGQIIFQDSGRYSYDYENPFRVFVSSSKAHNTVTINNQNFPWWGDFVKNDFYEGAVKNFHSTSEQVVVVLNKDFPTLNTNFNREFVLKRGCSLEITDQLTSNEIIVCEQWFHLAEQFEYVDKDAKGRLIFESEILKLLVTPPQDADVMLLKGSRENTYQGWVSYREKEITPRWSVGFKKNGKEVQFKTYFKISDDEKRK